jgi:hypothetical protein
MMEVHKPQRAMNMIPTGTSTIPKEISDKNTGILTLVVAGAKIAIKIKIIPTVAADDNIALLEILAPKEAPNRRPIIIKNQYVPTIEPATVGSIPISEEVANKFMKLGIPTSTPTYKKIAMAPKMK